MATTAAAPPKTNEVICISDDEDGTSQSPPPATVKREDGYNSSPDNNTMSSTAKTRGKRASSASSAAPAGYETPKRLRKRRSGGLRDDTMKPITPSATVQSSMNASLVFDMVTSLSTNDPGVAIAALRSVVVLGKEYPSNLLFDELIERMLSVEAIAYDDAVSIYASLVFVFDKAASCSCDLSFPHQWEPLAIALQDASVLAQSEERWRRVLLVVQFFIYCFKKDFDVTRKRYKAEDGREWLYRTRLFTLLHQGDAGTSLSGATSKRASANRIKIQNNLILQAISCGLVLWKRIYDGEDDTFTNGSSSTLSDAETESQLEARDACMAVVRLIEMLYLCTDQVSNILQRLQAGLLELSRETRVIFAQALELPDLKVRLATTMMGLTNKSRSTEHEWYECNTIGRLMQSIGDETTVVASNDVKVTDGYSWSHYDSFMNSKPRNDVTRLLHDIVHLQQQDN